MHPPRVTAEEFAATDRRSWRAPSAGITDDSAIALPPVNDGPRGPPDHYLDGLTIARPKMAQPTCCILKLPE